MPIVNSEKKIVLKTKESIESGVIFAKNYTYLEYLLQIINRQVQDKKQYQLPKINRIKLVLHWKEKKQKIITLRILISH